MLTAAIPITSICYQCQHYPARALTQPTRLAAGLDNATTSNAIA
jgi:hypothetical protein